MRGAELIREERSRQIVKERFTAKHDDEYNTGELADAAICYLRPCLAGRWWPWAAKWWKPKDRMRNLIRAGGLIAAEIDRLQRHDKGKP